MRASCRSVVLRLALGSLVTVLSCGERPHHDTRGLPAAPSVALFQGVVRDATGAPLNGAKVAARVGRRLLGQATTDPTGAYVLAIETNEDLIVSATKAGFVPLAFGQSHPFEPAAYIRPSFGSASRLDFNLEAACTLSGRIADDSGRPHPAVVSLAYASSERLEDNGAVLGLTNAPGVELRPMETDSNGRFAFDVQPGKYFVSAITRSGPNPGGIVGRHYFPATKDPAHAQPVECTGIGTADITVSRESTARISGRTVNPSGVPAAGAVVRLFSQSSQGRYYSLHSLLARTDATGRFTLTGVHHAPYVAVASVGQAWRAGGQQGDVARGVLSLDVREGGIEDVGIRMSPGMTVSGTVRPESLDMGLLPANLRVVSLCLDPRLPAVTTTSAAISPTGAFTIKNIFADETLYVDAPRKSGVYINSITSSSGDATGKALPFRSGSHLSGLSVILSSRGARIHGRVKSNDRMFTNAIVLLFATEESKWVYPLDQYVIAVRSDSRGEFEIANIIPGPYHAVAIKRLPSVGPLATSTLRRLKSAAAVVSVRLKAAETVTLNLDVQ